MNNMPDSRRLSSKRGSNMASVGAANVYPCTLLSSGALPGELKHPGFQLMIHFVESPDKMQ